MSGPTAEAYARHAGRYSEELAESFLEFAGVSPGMRVLDVGCGPGALTARLARTLGAGQVAGADPSENYIRACRERVPDADVRTAPAEALPFPDGVFDAVLAQLVVQVLADPRRALAEFCRVAAPGAVLATCVWDSRNGMPLLEAFWGAAHTVDPEGATQAGDDTSNPWCTREGLVELWSGARLEDIETSTITATAGYSDLEDAWWSFEAGVGTTGAYCRTLPEDLRARLRAEFCRRLRGSQSGPFELTATAWAIRGRVPALTSKP